MKRWLLWPIIIILMGCQSRITTDCSCHYFSDPRSKLFYTNPQSHLFRKYRHFSPSPVAVTGESTGISSPIPLPVSTESTGTNLPIPAFPGAEGFGANSVGGRGGKVIEVTNLDDSGPGTLRAAIEAEGPRIVVFRVAGTMKGKPALRSSTLISPLLAKLLPVVGLR